MLLHVYFHISPHNKSLYTHAQTVSFFLRDRTHISMEIPDWNVFKITIPYSGSACTRTVPEENMDKEEEEILLPATDDLFSHSLGQLCRALYSYL